MHIQTHIPDPIVMILEKGNGCISEWAPGAKMREFDQGMTAEAMWKIDMVLDSFLGEDQEWLFKLALVQCLYFLSVIHNRPVYTV
jgi:hypothetical protein